MRWSSIFTCSSGVAVVVVVVQLAPFRLLVNLVLGLSAACLWIVVGRCF